MPPRLEMDDYSLCVPFKLEGSCRLGDRCVYAHSNEELIEWRERLEYRYPKNYHTLYCQGCYGQIDMYLQEKPNCQEPKDGRQNLCGKSDGEDDRKQQSRKGKANFTF